MRTRSLLMAWVLVITTLLPVSHSQADELLRQRAGVALDVTGRRISIAENRVSSNPSGQAELILAASQQEQAHAQAAFAAAQYAVAVSATLSARDHADRAIAIARNLPDPERVQAQVDRTREVLSRSRGRVDSSNIPEARGMLRAAMAMQGRAEGAMSEERYMAALQLTMSARESVLRAVRLCNLDGWAPDSTNRELQSSDECISRGLQSLNGNSSAEARDMLSRAQSIQAMARAEARQERYESAHRLTQNARSLVQRATQSVRVASGSGGR